MQNTCYIVILIQEFSAGAVVLFKGVEYEYLSLHYPAGHWDFPKGNIEKNESELQTVKREIKEETGIDDLAIFDDFHKIIKYIYSSHGKTIDKQVSFYLAETKTKKVNLSHEHIGFEWNNFEDSINKLSYKNAKSVLNSVNDFMLNLNG